MFTKCLATCQKQLRLSGYIGQQADRATELSYFRSQHLLRYTDFQSLTKLSLEITGYRIPKHWLCQRANLTLPKRSDDHW